jgi:hypothetical protein
VPSKPFEETLALEINKALQSFTDLPLGDALKLAALQGEHRGLNRALQLFREWRKLDDENL